MFLRVFILLFLVQTAVAQYSPPAGQIGSIAVNKDDSSITAWATKCTVTRGYKSVATTDSGYVNSGSEAMALDKAGVNGVISLGDGGVAILEFEKPIINGGGYDFAVFENAFDDTYLELAHVEVSSDGTNYFRFPSVSNTDTVTQKSGFDLLDTKLIHNLAGKFRNGYGTPFDMEELKDKSGLDVNNVTHVKIIDVVGSLNNLYCSRDSRGVKINDPWPTLFNTGGFDLDAVAVMNVKGEGMFDVSREPKIKSKLVNLEQGYELKDIQFLKYNAVELYDMQGQKHKCELNGSVLLLNNFIIKGWYILQLSNDKETVRFELLVY